MWNEVTPGDWRAKPCPWKGSSGQPDPSIAFYQTVILRVQDGHVLNGTLLREPGKKQEESQLAVVIKLRTISSPQQAWDGDTIPVVPTFQMRRLRAWGNLPSVSYVGVRGDLSCWPDWGLSAHSPVGQGSGQRSEPWREPAREGLWFGLFSCFCLLFPPIASYEIEENICERYNLS